MPFLWYKLTEHFHCQNKCELLFKKGFRFLKESSGDSFSLKSYKHSSNENNGDRQQSEDQMYFLHKDGLFSFKFRYNY